MTMKKKLILSTLAVVILGGGIFLYLSGSSPKDENQVPEVSVQKLTIVDKVLAVGNIQPLQEIQVKSKVSGIVSRIFNDAGAYVRKGDPLIEIKPDPTPTELAEATRQVDMEKNSFDTVEKEKARQESMMNKGLISSKEYETIQQEFTAARLRLESAQDKLTLLKQGKVSIKNTEFSSIIRSEIDGYVLEKMVNIGDPVVPSTSFQPGQPVMTLADMNSLIFKGTVDEINIGRIQVGMPVELKIGALPNDVVKGRLSKIALKAEKKDNATNFPVEVTILPDQKVTLRAGYSANADIIIAKKENVLSVPERVVTFAKDSTFVMVLDTTTKVKSRKLIKTGLSDAINIEVVDGLKENEKVLEPELKTIK
ncbi:MAG: efflux RND transporter periplasmic adaptor subunit [Bacteroidetes bacterium]|nr:efflux RND transporter periplasmic adaptor subunit [Bacteroidota bacterium]